MNRESPERHPIDDLVRDYLELQAEQEDTAALTSRVLASISTQDPIVTEVRAAQTFFPAEAYHEDYFRRNPAQPYCRAVINPKVSKFRARFAHKLKSNQP